LSGAALYLELRALGLGVTLEEGPEYPDGCAVIVRGMNKMPSAERERLQLRIAAGKPGLVRLLRAEPNCNTRAVLQEAGVVADREEA